MWVERYKEALGKSNHGGQSLFDHTVMSLDAGFRVARLAGEGENEALGILLVAIALHDVGKLDPDFQAMMNAARSGNPLPAKKTKHEASSFDYDHVEMVERSKVEILNTIAEVTGYRISPSILTDDVMELIWALAVTHHGLFYLSYERDAGGVLQRRIRRHWTCFYPREEERITLVDLLVEFHPLGGLVIIGDTIASYCFEQERDLVDLFSKATTFADLLERLIAHSEEIESGIRQYDPRNYGLKQTLRLIGGGII